MVASPQSITVIPSVEELIDSLQNLPTEKVYIMATYTAVLDLRKELATKGYIAERLK